MDELWAMVLDKYPRLPSERTCIVEKRMMDGLRQSYYERLKNERKATQGILQEDRTAESAAG